MKRRTLFLSLFNFAVFVNGYIVEPGPLVKATKGAVWPKPQQQENLEGYFVLRPSNFRFSVIGNNCEVLQNAVDRYWAIILRGDTLVKKTNNLEAQKLLESRRKQRTLKEEADFKGYLDTLEIYLDGICDDSYPNIEMDEEYHLNVTSKENLYALLTAKSMWGAIRGLETFTQLVHLADDQITLIINSTNIHDYPRFAHRGLLLDTSRHFYPISTILQMLDAMSFNKMNVFHWHITDDQSFPYRSTKFPELSEMGAYHPLLAIYSLTDIKMILEYARFRGIRVIPEFDTPGHTRSWGVAIPELLVACYQDSTPTGQYGPMNPIENYTYTFLEEFFDEVVSVFPDKYLHVGADEVDFDCWRTNPSLNRYLIANNMSGQYAELENMFVQKLLKMVQDLQVTPVIWEDVLEHNIEVNNGTIVQVWKDDYINVLDKVTAAGNYAILSSCWYLDHLLSGGDWTKFYSCDPEDFPGTDAQKKLVIGGEACMWSESVDEYNVLQRVWPRASAAAEVLWSNRTELQLNDAQKRLEEHTCRMNNRGIPAQPPNAAGFCL